MLTCIFTVRLVFGYASFCVLSAILGPHSTIFKMYKYLKNATNFDVVDYWIGFCTRLVYG